MDGNQITSLYNKNDKAKKCNFVPGPKCQTIIETIQVLLTISSGFLPNSSSLLVAEVM